jgi:NAD(P)-dependent dehydrogenase (short-subunit alcohol dehydrogenase family)
VIDFHDRVAVVSGVGPGLGRDLALTFARAGADIVLLSRTASYLEEVAVEVEQTGRKALCVPADITSSDDCERVAAEAVGMFGHIDAIVHNAYVGLPFERLEDADIEVWRTMMDVNTFGALRLTQAALPAMKERGGAIVFINTQQIRRVFEARGPYAISKAALFTAAQVLAKELGRYRIRVNSVVVGWMDGPPLQRYFDEIAARDGIPVAEQRAAVAAMNPLGVIPSCSDPANAALFLASDYAGSITGQSLDVNAGETCS